MKKIAAFLKKLATSQRLMALACMLVCGTIAIMAQNSAGDYTAGTTALTTVTEESVFAKSIILVKNHIHLLKVS